MRIINDGTRPVAVPNDDGTTSALDPGQTLDVRLGNAEFAVRTFDGVRFADDPQPNGLAEASTEPAVGPIGEYVEAHPEDIRYAVIGDAPGIPGDVTVVGSDALSIEGGVTTAPVGTLPAVENTEGTPATPTPRRGRGGNTGGGEGGETPAA